MKLPFSLLFTADVFRYVAWCNAGVLCRGVSQRSLTGPTGLQAHNSFSARLSILAGRFPMVSLQAFLCGRCYRASCLDLTESLLI